MYLIRRAFHLVALALLTVSARAQQPQKPLDTLARGRLHDMLRQTVREIKNNYYDPNFHGVDVDGNFKKYDALLDQVQTQGEGFCVIAGFISDFHDSHLFFMPPPRPYRYEKGYISQIIGDEEYITQVRPGTDATEKLSPGDRVVHFNGFKVDRRSEHSMMYYFTVLAPATTSRLDLSDPGGKSSTVVVQSKMVNRSLSVNLDDATEISQLVRDNEGDMERYRDRTIQLGDVFIWKLAEFNGNDVDAIIRKAHNAKALVLDLRGDPGGRVDTLKLLLGHLFDHDVKLYDQVERKKTVPETAKTFGDKAFTGKLIVLIDSRSASCSEVASRVVQLEHRGTVLGDVSAGALMESIQYPERVGGDTFVAYGLSITMANLIMTDGKSIEAVGVMPDERILPTQDDLAAHRDPVLARAVELAGGKLDPAVAGKLFPFEWPKL